MSPRLFDRLAGAASVLILIGLGMSSYYFAKKAEQGQVAPPIEGRPDPDYFVEKMAVMRADATGAPSVRIEAEHMLHYPLDKRIDFANPLIISLDEKQPLMTVSARKGSAQDTGDIAELSEDVTVLRAATGQDAPLRVTMPNATIDLSNKIVRTEEQVEMVAGENTLSGVGMEIREQSHQLKLQSRVKGHFPATATAPVTSR